MKGKKDKSEKNNVDTNTCNGDSTETEIVVRDNEGANTVGPDATVSGVDEEKRQENREKTVDEGDGTTQAKIVLQDDTEAENVSTNTDEIVLPPEVTPAPRNDEEVHLDLFKANPRGILTYIPVSDDKGEVLGDTALEQQVKEFCLRYSKTDFEKTPDLAKVIEEAKKLATHYTQQTNMADNRFSGTIAKYRIRQGYLFNIMKEMVREAGFEWVTWFKRNFGGREFRSVQDYMRLAKIPGIIRYAFGERTPSSGLELYKGIWQGLRRPCR